jgi:hypothetical protein
MVHVRSGCAVVVAALAVVILFLQLPGPATCPSKAWRFSAPELEAFDSDPPPDLRGKSVPAVEAALVAPPAIPRPSRHAVGVTPTARPSAGSDAVVDFGVTRAPPAA